jgi:hypothetical protein
MSCYHINPFYEGALIIINYIEQTFSKIDKAGIAALPHQSFKNNNF